MVRILLNISAAAYCAMLAAGLFAITSNRPTEEQVIAACRVVGGCVTPTATANAIAYYQAQLQVAEDQKYGLASR